MTLTTQAAFHQALALHQAGRLAEAETVYRQIMHADPRDYPSRCMLGRLRVEQGRYEEAEKILDAAVKIDGQAPQGLAFYGVALLRMRKFGDAATMLERAVAAAPTDPTQRRNLGDALRGLGRLEEALASYDHALTLDARSAEVLSYKAETLLALKRHSEALAVCETALKLSPDLSSALLNRAVSLASLNRIDEAIGAYGAVLRSKPRDSFARGQRAHLLAQAQRYDEAVSDFDAALRADPRDTNLLILRGIALAQLRRYDQAIASYDAAIAIDPTLAEAFFNRGLAFEELECNEDAVSCYDQALALRPDYLAALNNRSGALALLRRFTEARAGIEHMLELEPDHVHAFGALAHLMLYTCDWSRRDEIEAGLREHVLAGKTEIPPGTLLAYLDDPAVQLACARNYVAFNLPDQRPYIGSMYTHDRIRIAYLSADFHEHPTARLAIELFERHDRSKFEVTAISFGPDDGSPMRARTRAAFENFYDVRSMSNADVVALLRKLEIDIAIDLKGYTQNARASVFAQRAAPIQVNYLAFPGTLGAEFYDYILADAIVAPMDIQPFFAERIVHLPRCYQPNDSKRAIPANTLSRSEAGLPEKGFVFCCFNNSFKIAPPFFSAWMRLLNAVDGSVLWLIEDSVEATANLRREAKARGIDPVRLVFAPRVLPNEHLARHRLADILLDTLPYGAHTTASDALWMGVPVVTCLGQAFAGRVGASLCHAAGLQELVACDLAEYEHIALSLALDPQRLATLKARLESDRTRHPLFDAESYCRGVEAAYEKMSTRYRNNQAPEALAVTL